MYEDETFLEDSFHLCVEHITVEPGQGYPHRIKI